MESPWPAGRAWKGLGVGVFLLALGARLAFQIGVVGMEAPPHDDASQYDAIGWSLSQGGPYVTEGFVSRRAPAYPIVLAGVYRLAGHSWPAARVAQALIGAAVCSLVMALGASLFDRRTGLLAGIGAALLPYSIYWSGYLLSEPLCTLLVAASTWVLIRCREGRLGWPAIWGCLCGLATLTRPNIGVLLALGVGWLMTGGSRRALRAALAIGVFGLTILPWTVRNYTLHHRLVPVTTMGGVVLWEGNNPYVLDDPRFRGHSAHAPALPEARLVEGLPEAELDAAYFSMAIRFMRDNLARMPGHFAWKLARLWNPFPELDSARERVAAGLTLAVLAALFAVGLGFAAARREPRVVPLLLPILAVTVTGVLYWADARIRAPADPEVVLVAAYGACSLWRLRSGASPVPPAPPAPAI